MTCILLSCQTYPVDEVPTNYLAVDEFPEVLDINEFYSTEKIQLLNYFTEVYSSHLKLLLSCEVTNKFDEEQLQEEIVYCQAVLDWIENIIGGVDLLD